MTPVDTTERDARAARLVARRARRLTGGPEDFDAILDHIGDASIVVIGTASRGTHEFYRIRGELTKRLIRDKGFDGVATDADWAAAQRVDRFVRGIEGTDANDALLGFTHFPRWEWRNADVLDFVGWLRTHNDHHRPNERAGFFGLDFYSLHASIAMILRDLRLTDPELARRAESRYACFDHFTPDSTAEAPAGTELPPLLEKVLVERLVEQFMTGANEALLIGGDDVHARLLSEHLTALARASVDYYAAMVQAGSRAWSRRDQHLFDTLRELRLAGRSAGAPRKLVVWTHNAHAGDAHWTEMSTMKELSLGQLVRENFPGESALIGFTTHVGTVTAAPRWDAPYDRKTLTPAMPWSYERLFHSAGIGNFVLRFDHSDPVDLEMIIALSEPRLERAIGAIYMPAAERLCHYYMAQLPHQFDAVFHYDITRALEPLDAPGATPDGVPAADESLTSHPG